MNEKNLKNYIIDREEIEDVVTGFELDIKYNWGKFNSDKKEEKLEAVKSSLADIKMLEAQEVEDEELQERIVKLRLAYERKLAELE